MKQAEDVVLGELCAALKEVELNGEAEAGDNASELTHELDGGLHGSAGGEKVIDDDDPLAGLDCVEVDFERVGAVFEVVVHAGALRGKLLWLAHGDEACVQTVCDGWAKDEAASFDAQDEVDFFADVVGGEGVDELREAGFVLEESGDVIEEDSRLGEVGDGANEFFQRLTVHDLRHAFLPVSFNLNWTELFGFALGQFMFDDGVYSAPA